MRLPILVCLLALGGCAVAPRTIHHTGAGDYYSGVETRETPAFASYPSIHGYAGFGYAGWWGWNGGWGWNGPWWPAPPQAHANAPRDRAPWPFDPGTRRTIGDGIGGGSGRLPVAGPRRAGSAPAPQMRVAPAPAARPGLGTGNGMRRAPAAPTRRQQ